MFTIKLSEFRGEIIDFLREVLAKRGTNYELINPQDIEDNKRPNVFYVLPSLVIKYNGVYREFTPVVIDMDEDMNISFGAVCTFDTSMEDITIPLHSIDTSTLCRIGDMVAAFENNSLMFV